MGIEVYPFGKLEDGTQIYRTVLRNRHGLEVGVLNYGGRIQSVLAPDREGRFADVVLGYDTLEEYVSDEYFFGAVVGRVANRIGGASFSLDGKTYSLTANVNGNTLHGGSGFI